jgi:TRAP-type C4-dicarboxylate transport system substrate-binding protein
MMLHLIRVVFVLLVLVYALSQPAYVTAEPVVIKFATLAPEGTPWLKLMEEMNDELQQQSNGQVAFRFYAGGIAGDESEVLRKIRLNQLQGGAFSGVGLNDILPDIRVIELPLLFRDAAEAEQVAGALFDNFAARLADQGYILLGLSEAGAVHLFSQQPLRSRTDLARTRMWTWQGDPLALAMFKAYGITPVPLALAEVLPALQSGLVDACYGPPLAILTLQWVTKVKYFSATPITHSIGAILLSQQQWQQLTAEQQALVRDLVTKYTAKAALSMRQHYDKALALLPTLGLQSIAMPDEEVAHLQQVSAQVREELVGTLYSRELLERVLHLRDQYRQNRPAATQ